MVSLSEVAAHNASLKGLGAGLVGVFVGGTSGIGESTARAFVKHTAAPKVYLIGRDETKASSIIGEFSKLNPEGQVRFIKSDVSLLRNVDSVCDQIKSQEDKINLLFLSSGVLKTGGRDETAEGLDKKFSLHYFSRQRFTMNLLPLLSRASGVNNQPARVISVLGAGHEARLNAPDDLDLAKPGNYTMRSVAVHSTTMTSLAVEALAAQNPDVAFIHDSPGVVRTALDREMTWWGKAGTAVLFILAKPWMVPVEESGERHLYLGTSPRFPAKSGKGGQENVQPAVGSDGITGSGAYIVSADQSPTGNKKVLDEYRKAGMPAKVWDRTVEVMEKATGKVGA
ncbi:short-chain dehydrogenase/reductase [Lineolata rhizophorae]|uniref:Short-chain dehydrogenase/reductase n=1 Tax=Lineolata rhizophorae TaxID=578093 RepID=A0A6A6PF09_9PEZI|nr:short-chain dehydrogenase/reductase [Lineolata rhizophorae]